MLSFARSLSVLAVLALGACSGDSLPDFSSSSAPGAPAKVAPPGSADPNEPPPPPGAGVPTRAAPAETTTVDESAPQPSEAARQAALNDCWAFANAQIARDEQMQSDRSNIGGLGLGSSSLAGFNDRMSGFENERRRNRLFRSCMDSRGFPTQ